MNLSKFKKSADKNLKENKQYLSRLKKVEDGKLDAHFHSLHEEVFKKIDCLTCANCCKTTSPIFYENDIERAAKAVKLKPGQFVEKYLKVDEDKDYVLKCSPCPFLDSENYCGIYESRPKACRKYPHTNRKKMSQVLHLAFENTRVCPAVLEIVERLKMKLP